VAETPTYEVVWADRISQWVARSCAKQPLAGIGNDPAEALKNLQDWLNRDG
jgi:hypothetical protein